MELWIILRTIFVLGRLSNCNKHSAVKKFSLVFLSTACSGKKLKLKNLEKISDYTYYLNITRFKTSKVLYICDIFGCWLLSCDISQAETKIILVKSWTNSQNDNYFHTRWRFFKNLTILTQKKLIRSACNSNYFCLSLWFMSQQPKNNTDAEHPRRSDI